MKRSHLIVILCLAGLIAGWNFIPPDIRAMLSLKGMQSQLETLRAWQQSNGVLGQVVFVLAYVAAAALSLPIASILTLLGGALFGFAQGVLLVLFGATIGASLAMLASRVLLREWVQKKFGHKMRSFEEGVAKEGAFYLFTLRVVPAFPFWLVNLLSGLTPIPLRTFFWVSFVGMAPGTMAYVFAGRQFGTLTSLGGILSPGLLGAFVALGVLPLVSKSLIKKIKANQVYKPFNKPKKFDYNMIAIGAGAGGLVTSYIGAAVGAKVALIEKHKMGGDCLNYGCVPSKALIHSAKVVHQAKQVGDIGEGSFAVDTAKVMQKVREAIATVAPHDSVERYTGLGVKVYQGEARLVDPWTVEVNGEKITARSIVLATGAEPFVPNMAGLELVNYKTSDTFWDLEKLPERVLVLGGGPIGCELAQALNRLGSKVVLVERNDNIMGREDSDVAQLIKSRFEAEGVQVRTGRQALRFEKNTEGCSVLVHVPVADAKGPEEAIVFDLVVLALGRKARNGFGMAELGVELRQNGTIDSNNLLQTNFPNIYVVGDATGPYQFTHFAAHQAWYAALNGLLAPFWSFKTDYSAVPWATYVDPQVARVGLSEGDALAQGIEYEKSLYHLDDLDRAIADNETHGFVKVLTVPGKDKILGVTIVAAHAGELLAEWTLALKNGLGLKKIMGTIHAYPTFAESSKYAAGVWAQAHKPQKALIWARRFFDWRRG
jgi:pyruvate/2-oxoglutarate dehydrogenase complex dihydrolipoamide dehydrogenase (E3) component/uncharacterized membrane protein YdjX (TVP38/TMEM64 family)